MEKRVNINIKSNDKTFTYLIGYERYEDSYTDKIHFPIYLEKNSSDVTLIGKTSNALRVKNNWMYYNVPDITDNKYIPDKYRLSKVNLYFPLYSVNVYKSAKYALYVYTYIREHKIELGRYIISRNDLLATPILKNGEQIYNEYIGFYIMDPYDIIYDDSWAEFRKRYCDEILVSDRFGEYAINNERPVISFSLYPINSDINNIYTTSNGYSGGENNISLNEPNHLELNIEPDFSDDIVKIAGDLHYNDHFIDIFDYVRQTYNIIDEGIIEEIPDIKYNFPFEINDIKYNFPYDVHYIIAPESWVDSITYQLIIYDKDYNIYYETEKLSFIKDKILNEHFKEEIRFDNWDNLIDKYGEFIKGRFIVGCLNIKNGTNEIKIYSNQIPLTEELAKFLVGNRELNSIDINKINDMSFNINTVNKTINNIIQVDNVNDTKSNIIQPVFFRAYDLNNIIIHPNVTENICINLDIYKSKVKTFAIQIDNKTFIESGRTSAGIIFKILGNKLNPIQNTSVYYIINENGDVVTSGKYTYEI